MSKYQSLLDKYNSRINACREIMTDTAFIKQMSVMCPDVDVGIEFEIMINWIVNTPKKSNKKLWLRFCSRWIKRTQSQGGNRGTYKRNNRPNRKTEFDDIGEIIEM